MKKRKRNPQDATLRNINTLKRRVKELEAEVTLLRKAIRWLQGPL